MAMLENALAGVLSGEDLTTAVVCLQENDVLTIEDARELSFDDLKELGFSIGMRNKMIKAFEKASDEANLKIGAVCKVYGVATRGELNGKKALVVGHVTWPRASGTSRSTGRIPRSRCARRTSRWLLRHPPRRQRPPRPPRPPRLQPPRRILQYQTSLCAAIPFDAAIPYR